jgi:copper chaperone CopZ
MRAFSFLFAAVAVGFVIEGSAAQDKKDPPAAKAEKVTYRVYGLFAADREKDLREAFKELTDITLVAVNYDEGEITVEFVPAKAFPGAKPEQVLERLDQKVRAETRHTFALGARRTIARDKLEQVVIPIVGLDCKACSLAAYEMIARVDGVDRVTASFKEGKVTALIDPTKTDKAKLEDIYRKRGVQVGKP